MSRPSTATTPRIVVGVDGSASGLAAVQWACADAALLHRALHLVHVDDVGEALGSAVTSPVGDPDDLVPGEPGQALATAVALARQHVDESRLSFVTVPGSPVAALVEASRTSHAVVVGARGRSRLMGSALGSVATQVVRHAHSPVVVVKTPDSSNPDSSNPDSSNPDSSNPDDGRVVVGVDGSAHSQRCLGFAFEQASARGVGLDVVHAWPFERSAGSAALVDALSPRHEVGPAHDLLVEDALSGWAQKHPAVDVRVRSIRAPAVTALLESAQHACLLVVGNRGRGGFAGLVLGSVSHTVLLRATCPVAVVRGQR